MVGVASLYIVLALLSLLAIAFVALLLKGRKPKPLSTLASIAFAFVLAGIIFGDNRAVGYSLIGIGLALAFIDIFQSQRKSNPNEKKKAKK
ncbi:MAG: hypothetical protein JW727_05405 [Candidatus Aenigmarchaeota archaeon]|nr:hypothetical protein [Candidatus Aenigmarchaeota archaeon]